ncbi:conserved hypothetical protein [Coccidioides posadasii str. Silveira]|uniref:Uncharacterized protein n=1 Tax=Coccidioides posadasii (strain RMSCC 757 / Silveira) TaxID=443226 RepID=E9D568_COCPS|nr:conserved hypothetical protein [Coccidioides posadasii str. Silveira]
MAPSRIASGPPQGSARGKNHTAPAERTLQWFALAPPGIRQTPGARWFQVLPTARAVVVAQRTRMERAAADARCGA